ncbi:MAG: glycosyltransferase family 4 protein [Acidimicrobiales bacterium]|jgi:glycosyltransferase involved in cell wall biosynthesis
MVSETGADSEVRSHRRGCRVVTTSMTARVLLANQLRSLPEIDWTVVSGDPYDDPIDGISVEVIPIRREFALSDVRSAVRLWRFLRGQRFDLVQTHTPKASFLGLPVARLVGSPALYTVHGSLYFDGNGRVANILGWCFERWCCSWATSVLVQSREDEGVLPRVHIAPAAKVHYVGNGIVLDRFLTPVAPALTRDRPVVLMVSRLVREKGCADFLEMAARLSDVADFVHVGPVEPDQSDALTEEEVAAAAGTVTFVGEVADVRPYLSSATVVVLPSYREGIPRAAMEAAATGRPVAAYDIRGVREVIDPGLGLLAPRGDVAALCAVVASLVDDPDRCDELGKLCRERIVERFSEDLVIERLRSNYAASFEGRDPAVARGAA